MTLPPVEASARHQPLRLWPGLIVAAFIVLVRFVLPVVAPKAEIFGLTPAMLGVLGGALGGLVALLWWLLFSRAPWRYRLGTIALMIAAAAATSLLIHTSIATGHMGVIGGT